MFYLTWILILSTGIAFKCDFLTTVHGHYMAFSGKSPSDAM